MNIKLYFPYNDRPKRDIKFAYYSQKDILLDTLTVEESLFYSSQLKICRKGKKVSKLSAKRNRSEGNDFGSVPKIDPNWLKVQKLIIDLHLEKCSKTLVSQCSGGQRRRLSIALELIFSPSVLLLDEPTSGLDSLSTLQCIQLLKQLVQNTESPMIIALVIHQPTAKLLQYFDESYVMSSTGQCIYEGPTTRIIESLSMFGLYCPQFHNPSDFAIEIASGEHGILAIKQLAEYHYNSTKDYVIEKENSIEMSKIISRTQRHGIKEQISTIWPLTKRCFLINVKNPKQYVLQITSVVLMLLLIYILHLDNKIGANDACLHSPSIEYFKTLHIFDILNPVYSPYPNWAFVFYSMLFVVFISMLPTLLSFPLEIAILRKEHCNGWYSLSSYFVAKNIADLPQSFIFPVIYCLCSYVITEQIMEMWRLFSYCALLILLSILSQGFGFMVSAIFVDNITASTVIGAIVNIPLLLFAGLLIKIQTIPKIFQPLTYISYFRLTFESIMLLIYGFGRCEHVERVSIKTLKSELGDHIVPMSKCIYDFDPELLENITLAIDYFNDMLDKSSSFAIQAFEYQENNIYFNIVLLVLYTILLRFFAYILLVWKIKVK